MLSTLMQLPLAAFIFTLASCGETPGPGFVTVYDNVFAPASTHPAANGVVSWVWNGSNAHNVVFDDDIGNSIAQTNGSHSRNFTSAAAGTYRYRCTLHTAMVGEVVVP